MTMKEGRQENSEKKEEKSQSGQQLSQEDLARELAQQKEPREGSQPISDAGKRRDDEERYQ
jgi:hypothetical protein